MSKLNNKKLIILISMTLLIISTSQINAESLFRAGISQDISPMTPRSWFQSIRATNIGDIVTIEIEEKSSMENTVTLDSNKKAEVKDAITPIVNKWKTYSSSSTSGNSTSTTNSSSNDFPVFDTKGSTKVTNAATIKRANSMTQTITTQVVQVLPNGNLVLQGKKSIVNSGERQDMVISGIVNPRQVDGSGRVKSMYVANLQIGIVGKGTASRVQSDGIWNKVIRLFF